MNRRALKFLCIAFTLIIGGITRVWLLGFSDPSRFEGAGEPIPYPLPASFDPLLAQVEQIRPLHEKKRPIQPGDWLDRNPEGGQRFTQYVQMRGGRPLHDQLTTIYVQPFGEFDSVQQRIIEHTAEFVRHYFGTPITTLDTRSLDDIPDEAKRISDEGELRLSSKWLMDLLTPDRPDDAIAVIGLVTNDLWSENHRWIFGEASMSYRIGVWSLHRNGDPHAGSDAYRICLRRTLKTGVHELGHMLGIPHCAAWECAMNGSRSREENDSQPLEFCPECQPKIWWSCGADPITRCRALLSFAEREHLSAEAAFWRRELQALSGPVER